MDESFTPFVELYRSSGKSLIDEDFSEAWWKWRVLDFEQKQKRIDRLKYNLQAHCYGGPNFIPAPKKFVETEWKRELKSHENGSSREQKAAEQQAAFERMVREKYGTQAK
jgi:hypothetical protein